jgi:hypothetical protein
MIHDNIFKFIMFAVAGIWAMVIRELRGDGTKKKVRRSYKYWIVEVSSALLVVAAVAAAYLYWDLNPILGFLLSMIGGLCSREIIDIAIRAVPTKVREKAGVSDDTEE